MKIEYKIDEEITRWSFEAQIKQNKPDWFIAFTNPTAGPWKKIEAEFNGIKKEIYRFGIEESRPDIIMYNDKLQCVIIFEAKRDPLDIIKPLQVSKSYNQMIEMSSILSNINVLEFWEDRKNYTYILGLLWFENTTLSPELVMKTYSDYYDENYDQFISDINIKNNDIISIVVKQVNNDLIYTFHSNNLGEELHQTLKLSL